MYWKAPILGAFFLFEPLCGKQLAEPRDLECHKAVKSLFCAVLTDLRVFAFAADLGLTPEGSGRRAALLVSNCSGERPLWRVALPRGGLWLILVLLAGACFLADSAYR